MPIVTLGDLVLDVVVRLEQPLAPGADASASIVLEAGGQAANVAAWAVDCGAPARWVGKRGDDDAGRLAEARLRARGVELAGVTVPAGNGVIVSLVDPDGERTMCPDRGVATELTPAEVEPGWLEGCTWLHVSGYALFRPPVRDAAVRAVRLARDGGARISIDLASWSGIRDAGARPLRELVERLAPDVVFCNEDEDEAIGGRWSGPAWILKRGARGCSFDGEERSARPVDEIVDSTGAGDALAAGWLVGGPELALEAAARCVQRVGAMPEPR